MMLLLKPSSRLEVVLLHITEASQRRRWNKRRLSVKSFQKNYIKKERTENGVSYVKESEKSPKTSLIVQFKLILNKQFSIPVKRSPSKFPSSIIAAVKVSMYEANYQKESTIVILIQAFLPAKFF